LSIIKATAKINSIFLAVILIVGTFAAVYPSFIIGVQAQAEYEYDSNSYNSEYPPSEYPPSEYPPSEYPPSEYPPSEYPPSEYETDNKKNNYYYPPKNPISADIVVPVDFPTIQQAINEANEGDTIEVLPGTYTEQLTINKTLTIIGSGVKSTIIEAPPLEELKLNVIGLPYIVEVNDEAEVTIEGFTILGPEGTDCGQLIGVSVLENGTINLKHSNIKGCTQNSVGVGFEGDGHATITKTFITDYREHGVFAFGSGTTLTMSDNKVIGSAPEEEGIIGILSVLSKVTITHNEVSKNICNHPDCGPNFLNQTQAFGIVAVVPDQGSVISKNYLSNNDGGIDVEGASGCCRVDQNKLTDNRFFGVTIVDGEHTISNSKIFGGKVGAAAIAFFEANTTATLDQVKIIGAETPIQALSTGNLTAAVNVLSPSVFLP
jgi:nitrous oxidase accessory protein NosD